MTLPLNLSLFQRPLISKTVSGDLNALTNSGFYFVQNPTNGATTNWAHVLVNSSDNQNRVLQLFFPDAASQGVWYRDRNDGTWSNWEHVLTSDQVTTEVTNILTTAEF